MLSKSFFTYFFDDYFTSHLREGRSRCQCRYHFHPLGYVWNLESTRERKKNTKENGFLMFGFTMENIKEKQTQSKFLKILYIFKILSPYIRERIK